MNIIEKYDKPFQYGTLILNIVVAYHFFILWYQAEFNDASKIISYAILMAFEFIMVHSGVFMAIMPKGKSILLLIPFYGVFALCFSAATDDNSILILYCVVVFNRMRFAFSDVTNDIKSRVVLGSILSLFIYFVLIFVVLIFQSLIPKLALTADFLNDSGYLSSLRMSGEFVEKPHIALCFGVIYYICLAALEAYFISITFNEEDIIDEEEMLHKKINKRFNLRFKNKKRNR